MNRWVIPAAFLLLAFFMRPALAMAPPGFYPPLFPYQEAKERGALPRTAIVLGGITLGQTKAQIGKKTQLRCAPTEMRIGKDAVHYCEVTRLGNMGRWINRLSLLFYKSRLTGVIVDTLPFAEGFGNNIIDGTISTTVMYLKENVAKGKEFVHTEDSAPFVYRGEGGVEWHDKHTLIQITEHNGGGIISYTATMVDLKPH